MKIQGIWWSWINRGANFHIQNGNWNYQNFKGSKWQNINQDVARDYLKNTYRVLLTRARQGIVIYIPNGSNEDPTRMNQYYDGTYNYFKSIGIKEITTDSKE
jgi:hypothetical protein